VSDNDLNDLGVFEAVNLCETCAQKLPCPITGVGEPGAWQKGFPCGSEGEENK